MSDPTPRRIEVALPSGLLFFNFLGAHDQNRGVCNGFAVIGMSDRRMTLPVGGCLIWSSITVVLIRCLRSLVECRAIRSHPPGPFGVESNCDNFSESANMFHDGSVSAPLGQPGQSLWHAPGKITLLPLHSHWTLVESPPYSVKVPTA